MNALALKAYAGTVLRYVLVWLVAKFGFQALIGDQDITLIVDALTGFGLVVYGVWSKRKALATPPADAGISQK